MPLPAYPCPAVLSIQLRAALRILLFIQGDTILLQIILSGISVIIVQHIAAVLIANQLHCSLVDISNSLRHIHDRDTFATSYKQDDLIFRNLHEMMSRRHLRLLH